MIQFVKRALSVAACALMLHGIADRAYGQAAMIYGTDAVSSPDSVSLPQPNERWFTQGNGTSINGTQVPAYWVNKVAGEESTVIHGACALTLNMAAYNQLNTCILAIQASITAVATQVIHGRLLATVAITSSGTFTPVAGAVSYEIEIVAAGGGGGGAAATDSAHVSVGSGGGAGGFIRFTTTANLSGANIIIGAGGAGGAAGSFGAAGGLTSVGGAGYCPATGTAPAFSAPTGLVGQVGSGGPAATPCAATGSSVLLATGVGNPGENALYFTNAIMSGLGGASIYGGSGANSNGGAGGTAMAPGAGGGGGGCPPSCPGYAGGGGGPGLVIIHEYS